MQWWKTCFSDTWRDVALWVTLPSLRQQFLFRAVAHNPRAPSCTCSYCSIQVRTGWSSRTMSSVGAVLLLWTFSHKFNTKKDVCVRLMQPKHNERFFFFSPKLYLMVFKFNFKGVWENFFSTPAHFLFVRLRAKRRERCRGTTCPYTKLFYNYIENKFQLKYDLLLFRGLRGEELCSCVFTRVIQRWLTSGLCFILELSFNIGQITIKSLTPAFITMPSLALMLRPKPATCLFFFFAYMLADADTSCGVFVCGPCEWMEPHRREVFMHHHSLSSAVGCWEAVSRSFLVCLLTPTKVSIDEFIPLCFWFFVFFNVGLLILSVSVF